jgi:hypothetical protein
MVTPQKCYVYFGILDASHIYNQFLKDEQYLRSFVHGGSNYTTRRIIDEGKDYI